MKTTNFFLQSYKKNNEVLDLSSGQILQKTTSNICTNGWYNLVGEKLSYILFDKRLVSLCVGETICIIDAGSSASLIHSANESIFQLYQDGELQIMFSYKRNSENMLESSFGFSEDEDFDWGKFLVGVINSPERIKLIADYILENHEVS
ncbi:MAG: hypothetical protein ABIX01_14915 [Chitinophagaceae bacterium]